MLGVLYFTVRRHWCPSKGHMEFNNPPPKVKKKGLTMRSRLLHGPYENLPFCFMLKSDLGKHKLFTFSLHVSNSCFIFQRLSANPKSTTRQPVVLYNPFWCMLNSKLPRLHSQQLLPKQIIYMILLVDGSEIPRKTTWDVYII